MVRQLYHITYHPLVSSPSFSKTFVQALPLGCFGPECGEKMAVNAGQTLNDRLLAAKHSIAGQGLAKAVCKATTEELIGPKKKHLDCEIRT